VSNAADAIAAALTAPRAACGRAYVVTNGEPRPVRDLLAGICAAAGAPSPAWSVPAGLARAVGGLVEAAWSSRLNPTHRSARPGEPGATGPGEPPMTRFLAEQLSTAHWFDQRTTRAALGWVPAVSLDAGLALLAASYRGERPRPAPGAVT